jgi:hypothetical protein
METTTLLVGDRVRYVGPEESDGSVGTINKIRERPSGLWVRVQYENPRSTGWFKAANVARVDDEHHG